MEQTIKKDNPKHALPNYTVGEEIFNSVSHGVGAVLGVGALVWLLMRTIPTGNPTRIVSAAVYGFSLVLLYTMSTLYHAIPGRAKPIMRKLDHCTIYVLIAGSYMPYLLLIVRGPLGIGLMAAIWSTAILGIVLNAINVDRFKVFSHFCYLVMGWAALVAIVPIWRGLPLAAMMLMIFGGLSYTGGMAFYAMKKYRYMHSIWHLFVMLGSLLHFFAAIFYIFLKGA